MALRAALAGPMSAAPASATASLAGGAAALSRTPAMSEPTTSEERAERWRTWMVAAQQGDAERYAALLEELLPFVRGIVRARLPDDAAYEDVSQEVLMRIHTARHTYRGERPLLPWVRTIARNAVIDHARRRGRALARSSDVEVDAIAADAPADAEPLSPALARALTRLPDAQRQAVTLLKLEGLSVKEAAERVGVTPGALKLRAHRGYRILRDLLGREVL